MNTDNILKYNFQYYCNSSEESNSPLIPVLIETIKFTEKISIFEKKDIIIAASYGKRLLISIKNSSVETFERKDFTEIIDVDPIKNTVLFFGPSKPPNITPLVWMIHYAKKEIQFSIYLPYNIKKLKEKNISKIPIVTIKSGFIETVKDIMKNLQKSNIINIDNKAIIITAETKIQLKENIKRFRDDLL